MERKTGIAGPPRLSEKEELVLRLLVDTRREMFGLQLVEASDRALRRGTVYVTLDRMERDKGFITSRKEADPADGAAARRLYRPTALGESALAAWDEFRAGWKQKLAEGAT